MPSPISRTRPTSRVSSFWPKPLISSVRTETISLGLNRMTAPRDDLVAQIIQTCANRGVELPVADTHLQPAQELRIDPQVEDRLQLEAPPHRVGNGSLQII